MPDENVQLAFAPGGRKDPDELGIELHPDVLPLSNIPAWLPPFLLRPDSAMALAE